MFGTLSSTVNDKKKMRDKMFRTLKDPVTCFAELAERFASYSYFTIHNVSKKGNFEQFLIHKTCIIHLKILISVLNFL